MKAREVLQLLQVTRVTLSKYVKAGLIKTIKKGNGKYDYDMESVYKFLGKSVPTNNKMNIIYARTSNPPKRYCEEQSQRLIEYCTNKGITVDKIITDVKSGMNFERNGLQELLDLVFSGEVENIIIENKDRLCRFGFDLIKQICLKYNCNIIIANDLSEKNFEQELTEDLIAIIHYFSMKSYSNRRKLNKIKKELLDDNTET